MSENALTTYSVDDDGVCLCSSIAPTPATRSTPKCSTSCSPTSHRARERVVRAVVVSSTDHMGLSAGADVARSSTRTAGYGECSSSHCSTTSSPATRSRRSRPATGLRRRRRRDRGRLRPAGRRLEPAPALPRRRARGPGRPGAAGHPLRALDRQIPVADLQGGRRRHGLPLGPGPQGGAGRSHRGGGAQLAADVAANPPESVARLKRMLHEWDGVEDRSRTEGEGQVCWAGTHSVPAEW